ncbi:MAG: Maf family protein [Patescibacteria group bacterium]|nr:Maf family protein [Patescibacteria group bacterium]
MQIILASDSPRRKQLLSWTGLEFKAVSHRVDEEEYRGDTAEDLVGQLAIAKATSIEPLSGGIVIGSDLVVAKRDKFMSKPKDLNQAREYLRLLSGKTHSVFCGVAVASRDKVLMSVASSWVGMKPYDDKIIEAYIKQFHVLDKGGAYAIQFELPGYGSLVKMFGGGITTIIGLPLEHLENLLKEFGVKVKADWTKQCKIETGYEF